MEHFFKNGTVNFDQAITQLQKMDPTQLGQMFQTLSTQYSGLVNIHNESKEEKEEEPRVQEVENEEYANEFEKELHRLFHKEKENNNKS